MATGVAVGAIVCAGALIPAALNHATSRNALLNQALNEKGLSASSGSSTGGWLTPFEFHDVVVSDEAGQVQCRIDTLKTGRSIVDHLLADGPVTVTLVRPNLDVALDDEGRLLLDSTAEESTDDISFRIEDGAITLRVPWRDLPIVELNALEIQGTVVHEANGRWLTVDEIEVLDHAKLSDRHTEQNLALVAPLVSQATSLQGTVSARLNPVRICLDKEIDADQVLLDGTVQIHNMEAHLRQQWSRSLVQLVGHFNQNPLPPHLSLISDSAINFSVTSHGIHHSGFSLVLPDIADGVTVDSSGTLQLDEQLDLALNIQLPATQRSGSSLLNTLVSLVRAPIQLRVTGTVSSPTVTTPDGRPILEEITQRVDSSSGRPSSVAGSLGKIIQAGATKDKATRKRELPGRIFGLIRAIEDAKTE